MPTNFTPFAFGETACQLQERYGSRKSYERLAEHDDRPELTWKEVDFLQSLDGFYVSTVGENGWPYVQFRGGPKGFIHVPDAKTIAFADFRGNRQYISTANLHDTSKAVLFFMDYPKKQRLKVWAEGSYQFAEDAPELVEKLAMPGYDAKIERVVMFKVLALDWNCPQHIPQRYTLDEIRKNPILMKQLTEA